VDTETASWKGEDDVRTLPRRAPAMYIVVREGIDRCRNWSEEDPVWSGLSL
jgi:hypothetical protein